MASAGRIAANMTLEQFKKKFKEVLCKCADPDEHDITAPSFDPVDVFYHLFCDLKSKNSKMSKDLEKIEFDTENIEWEGPMLGFQMLDGLACFGVEAGGDWESPVYFVLYFDDKGTLRGYIPKDGNVYNVDKKCAFGNNGAYETYGRDYDASDPSFKGCDEEVVQRVYGVASGDPDDIEHDDAKLKKDILGRIAVVGSPSSSGLPGAVASSGDSTPPDLSGPCFGL